MDSLNASVLNSFGEKVTFALNAGSVELTAIFSRQQINQGIGAASFTDDYHTLELLTIDVENHAIPLRSTVTVRSINYQVIEIAADTGGMSKLILRKFA